jgi:hypothetical protein
MEASEKPGEASEKTEEASEKSREASSQHKSLEQAPMDVSEDEQDEALLKLNEDEL